MPSDVHHTVVRIAQRQKLLIWIILLQLLLYGLVFGTAFLVTPMPDLVYGVLGLFQIALGLGGLIAVFLLASLVYNAAIGALLAVLMVVPLINLIVLLTVNAKAMNTLRRNDISVGFLGAKLKSE